MAEARASSQAWALAHIEDIEARAVAIDKALDAVPVCERHPGWKTVWCNECIREERHARPPTHYGRTIYPPLEGGPHRWPDR